MGAPGTTPGPWSLAPAHVIVGNNGMRVCVVPIRLDQHDVADCHQIAASGDLYDALAALVSEHIERGPFDEPCGESEQTPEINAAVRALRKARGETPHA